MPPNIAVLRPLSGTRALSKPTRASLQVSSPTTATLRPSRRACFSSTSSQQEAKNRVYSPVRNHDQFLTYVQLSSTARTPLLTLWTTSSCRTCHQVSPLLRHLVEDQGVGEAEGGVSYCEVEYDAPDVMRAGLGITYLINHVPTLLSFDAGEAQAETRVSDGNKLRDRHFLEEWIRTEARRHGGRGGGGGGGLGSSLFGGLFGSFNNKH